MPAAVFAFQDLGRRLKQLRGERSSGVRYERQDDGSHRQVRDHEIDPVTGNCMLCHFRREDFEDNVAPVQCSGEPPRDPECFFVTAAGVKMWRHPDGSRFDMAPNASADTWRRFREWRQYGKTGKPFEYSVTEDDWNKAFKVTPDMQRLHQQHQTLLQEVAKVMEQQRQKEMAELLYRPLGLGTTIFAGVDLAKEPIMTTTSSIRMPKDKP